MANNFLDSNGVLYLWQKIKNIFATKEELNNSLTNLGGGDMLKSVYDTDNNGKVDKADTATNAEKFGDQLPEYYAKKSELFSGSYNDLSDKPEGFAPTDHDHEISDVNGLTEAANEIYATLSSKADASDLENAVGSMTEIANGKCDSYVFDTEADLEAAITEYNAYISNGTAMSESNVLNGKTLKIGDVLLIKAVDVPDYWWDGGDVSILETTKVVLNAITNAEIDTIVAS